MDPRKDAAYRWLLKEFLKRQMVVFGPNTVLIKMQKIPGLGVDTNGNIVQIKEDPGKVIEQVLRIFLPLSQIIVRRTLDSIFAGNSNLELIKDDTDKTLQALSDEKSKIKVKNTPVPSVSISEDIRAFENNFQAGINAQVSSREKQPLQEKDSFPPASSEGLDSVKVEEVGKMFEEIKEGR